jgi:hypothetical protein
MTQSSLTFETGLQLRNTFIFHSVINSLHCAARNVTANTITKRHNLVTYVGKNISDVTKIEDKNCKYYI